MKNLLSGVEVRRVGNALATGQGATNSSGVESDNAEGIVFLIPVGAIAATGTIDVKLPGSSMATCPSR